MDKDEKKAQFFLPGDKVIWKGIKLTVLELLDDGSLIVWSPTLRVHVSGPEMLERYGGGQPTSSV